MMIRLNSMMTVAAMAGLLSAFAPEARARCAQDDFICEKFKARDAKPASARRTTRATRPATKRSRRVGAAGAPLQATRISPANAPPAPTPASTEPPDKQPQVRLTMLQSGAIADAPAETMSLIFGSADRVEVATANCNPAESSKQRIACAVAVHLLTKTGGASSSCTGSLDLRHLEFAKTEDGNWVNEDSIILCGGRLLRRTELFPVALNGTPHYALREEYQMIGGDRTCAAPYLRSRQPQQKSYMPLAKNQSSSLTCGTVATR